MHVICHHCGCCLVRNRGRRVRDVSSAITATSPPALKRLFRSGIKSLYDSLPKGKSPILVMEDKEFPTKLHLYHAVARSLARGYDPSSNKDNGSEWSKRPELPVEIVEDICRYADFRKPGLVLTWQMVIPDEDEARSITCWESAERRELLCATGPITSGWLLKAAAVKVITNSRDQGWCRSVVMSSTSFL